jgi:CubicO group peptidase (beta-lactamase class C family)
MLQYSRVFICVFFLAVCGSATLDAAPLCTAPYQFGYEQPESQGIDSKKLVELTQWIRDNPVRVLSVSISRNGKIVYELYSSKVDHNAAHYLMSVTKSVTSALVGIAIDRHLIKNATTTVVDNLPKSVFPSAESYQRFSTVTLKDVLGMSALDAQVPPHLNTPEAIDRNKRFNESPNRLKFALTQSTLAHVGSDFQYTDITPFVAGGIVEYGTRKSLFDFGKNALFGPMGFSNEEWMHEDPAGFDNPAYGLRLRPVDMQKFGMLYLNHGCWKGQQILSEEWISTSFSPWIKSNPARSEANYGWYWWQDRFSANLVGHTASGWKGQRITVFPSQAVVVTTTAIIEDGSEDKVYRTIVDRFIGPAIAPNPLAPMIGASFGARN